MTKEILFIACKLLWIKASAKCINVNVIYCLQNFEENNEFNQFWNVAVT